MSTRRMLTKILLTLLLIPALSVCALAAECDAGIIRSAGLATLTTPPDVLTLAFQIELESDSFAGAKDVGDQFRQQLERLHPQLPQGALLSVGYDFGVLKQARLAWSRGKKLEYQFVVTVTAIPEGEAQAVLVHVVDGALELNSKLIVEEVEASLSEDLARRVRSDLLRAAVENARANALTIADAAALRLATVSSVAMAEAAPVTTYGVDFDGISILGRSYQDILVLRRRFSVDAGVPGIELTGAIVATFCAEPN